MSRLFLFTILTTVILLASGCSRSQAAPSAATPLVTTSKQESGYEGLASPTFVLNTPSARFRPGATESPGLQQSPATQKAPSITKPNPDPLPNRSLNPLSDLLYLTQDRLMRWDPLTGQFFTLAQNVSYFSISLDGKSIVLLRPQRVTANGIQQFDLEALNLVDQQVVTLVKNVAKITKMAISPDGGKVAFTQEEANGDTIHIAPVTPGSQSNIVGTCQPGPTAGCASLVWSPDSRYLLWSDASGLWQAAAKDSLEAQKAQLIHPNHVQVKDPKGQTLEIKARFTDLEFGPVERFILVKVAPLNSPVGWQAVFDRRSGFLAQATDTYGTGEIETMVKWQANGDLLVGRASEPTRHTAPYIHIWHIIPTNPELLVSGKQFNLYSDDFPFSATQSKSIPAHCLNWLTEAQPNHLVFAIQLHQSDDPPVLFDLNLQNESLVKLQTLPVETTQILWSPDGIHALILGGRNQIYLFSMRTGEFNDLPTAIGPGAHHFTWMPPVLRK